MFDCGLRFRDAVPDRGHGTHGRLHSCAPLTAKSEEEDRSGVFGVLMRPPIELARKLAQELLSIEKTSAERAMKWCGRSSVRKSCAFSGFFHS